MRPAFAGGLQSADRAGRWMGAYVRSVGASACKRMRAALSRPAPFGTPPPLHPLQEWSILNFFFYFFLTLGEHSPESMDCHRRKLARGFGSLCTRTTQPGLCSSCPQCLPVLSWLPCRHGSLGCWHQGAPVRLDCPPCRAAAPAWHTVPDSMSHSSRGPESCCGPLCCAGGRHHDIQGRGDRHAVAGHPLAGRHRLPSRRHRAAHQGGCCPRSSKQTEQQTLQ